jgi:hypothetical protein
VELFGPPSVLEGEDITAYDELLGRICAAIKPVDIIDEIFINDVVSSEWDVLRWRRLKSNLIRASRQKGLENFLYGQLDYDCYRECFTDDLTEILMENLGEEQVEDVAYTLAHDCAQNKPDAVDKVNEILSRIDLEMDHILNRARTRKAEEFTKEYTRRKPNAVKLIDGLLAKASVSIDALALNVLAEELDHIERIDRLATNAENRRNATLREIDQRRAVLGETLRRRVQEVEDRAFEVIEARPAKGKTAA